MKTIVRQLLLFSCAFHTCPFWKELFPEVQKIKSEEKQTLLVSLSQKGRYAKVVKLIYNRKSYRSVNNQLLGATQKDHWIAPVDKRFLRHKQGSSNRNNLAVELFTSNFQSAQSLHVSLLPGTWTTKINGTSFFCVCVFVCIFNYLLKENTFE